MCCFSACTATLKFYHTQDERVWGPRLTPMWVSPILPFQHCSLAPTVLMHLVRAAYVPKRKLPYPSACCVHCPSPVGGTRGTREQHQSQSFAAGYCCPYRGSWPPSDLVPDRCMLQRVPGCVVRSFPQTLAVKPPLLKCDPCAFLCPDGCTYGLGAQGHPGLQHPR